MLIPFRDAVVAPGGCSVLFVRHGILHEVACDPLFLHGIPRGKKFSGMALKGPDKDHLQVISICCLPPEEK